MSGCALPDGMAEQSVACVQVRVASAMLAYSSCHWCACRFYDPSAGHITVGDHEVRDVTMASLRTKFGVVPQVCPVL